MKVTNLILIPLTVTAGFGVTKLSANSLRQSPVLADRPVAYYRLGEAPGSAVAVDSSVNARDDAYERTPKWRILRWNTPFTIETWVQLVDDYQVNSRIFGQADPDTGAGFGLDIPLSEASLPGSTDFSLLTPLHDDIFVAPGVLDQATIHNYGLPPIRVKAHQYEIRSGLETSVLELFIGLVLILFGLVFRERPCHLESRARDGELSRGRTLQVGMVKLRKRSESELNSLSACYANIEVRAEAPLTGCGPAWRAASRYTRH